MFPLNLALGAKVTILTFLMDRLVCWNIRGLNEPCKQFSVKNLLASNKAYVAGILEKKVRDSNKLKVLDGIGGWDSITNSSSSQSG